MLNPGTSRRAVRPKPSLILPRRLVPRGHGRAIGKSVDARDLKISAPT